MFVADPPTVSGSCPVALSEAPSLVRTRMRLRQLFNRRTWHVLVGAPLLACLLITAGCSARFLYNRLDTLAGWYFESLVSLNDGQRTELRAWLERTLAWHRESELARYAVFIDDVAVMVAQPNPRETYDAMRTRFQGLLDSLIAKTAPEASRLLLRLSPEQVDELLANLEEKALESTQESAEEVADGKWRPDQTKNIIKQMKRWTGDASKPQKELIAATVAQLEPTYAEWADSQRAWRQALREALAQRAATEDDATSSRVLELLEDPDRQWTSAYAAKVARNRERYQQLIMALDATLSAEQREHLRTELTNLANTLTRLAKS